MNETQIDKAISNKGAAFAMPDAHDRIRKPCATKMNARNAIDGESTSPHRPNNVSRRSSCTVTANPPSVRAGTIAPSIATPSLVNAREIPVFATRTIGVRFSMQRQRAINSCWRRPQSLKPNHPSFERFTIIPAFFEPLT